MNGCIDWLAQYRGSTIPAHMSKVTLYYRKPIFITLGQMPLQELHALGEEAEVLGRGDLARSINTIIRL